MIGKLVFHKELGRGIVEKISPSKSLIEVRFKHAGKEVVLNSTLQILSYE
jgi:hypothetical protein